MRNVLLLLIALCLPVQAAEVYFSPGVRDQVIKRINTSKSTIDIAVYSFTSGDIAEALGRAAKRGVKVRVIRDYVQSSNHNDENSYLIGQNIPVLLQTGEGRGIMHNKFAIFDHREAVTGSYNWTENAERFNKENAIFSDEQNVVQAFDKQFEILWQKGNSHGKQNGRLK